MVPTDTSPAAERLARLKESPDCVTYGVDLPGTGKRPYRFSIYGLVPTGEIFVEVKRGGVTRVESFLSRHKHCPPEERRQALTLVDAADAYGLARLMVRHWRHRSHPPFPSARSIPS